MSMGPSSYDVTPVRRSRTPRASTEEPEGAPASPAEPVREADYSLPTYVSVGGGLSNTRIVTKMPAQLGDVDTPQATLERVIKYMISSDVATSDQDRAVAEAIQERIAQPDCRVVINNYPGLGTPFNYSREHLQDPMGTYLVRKTQTTASGPKDVNFTDIAILTHDEGGYRTLDRLCR